MPALEVAPLQLRQDSDRNFGKHSRYGYVEINLAEWAWDKCDGEQHNFAMLVQGTNNTSLLEVEVGFRLYPRCLNTCIAREEETQQGSMPVLCAQSSIC